MKLRINSPEHIEAVRLIELEFGRELSDMKLSFLDTHPYLKAGDLECDKDWQFVLAKWEERRHEEYLMLKVRLGDGDTGANRW
jgi:hypothetical protein